MIENIRNHRCAGPGLYPHAEGCRDTLKIEVPVGLDDTEAEEHCIEVAEASFGWYRGLFCPDCSPQAYKEDQES